MEWFRFVVAGLAAVSRCAVPVTLAALRRTIRKHRFEWFSSPKSSRNRAQNDKKRVENRSKTEVFGQKATRSGFLSPFGPPRSPQGRPKAPQGRPRLGPVPRMAAPRAHFGVIFGSSFVFFSGFVFGSFFLWLGRRFRYHFAFISEVIFHVFLISAKNAGPYEYAAPAD